MNKSSKLFGTAGIRGLYGQKITADLIIYLSQAIAHQFPSYSIVVGHDARTTSESLAQYACASLSTAGVTVFNVGLVTFPVIANLTLDENHPLAIYITASHNPAEYNGIKVLRNGREFTSDEQEFLEVEISKKRSSKATILHKNWDSIPSQINLHDANVSYVDRIKKNLDLKGDGRTIIIDSANGPMSLLSPKLLTTLGFRVISVNSHVDGSFPGRPGEPSVENLGLLIGLCKKEKSIGLAHDGDGDRVTLIDETGKYVELSRVNAILAKLAIDDSGKGTVVISIDSSTCIDKFVKDSAVNVIRTNLGELHGKVRELQKSGVDVAFAAEPWKPIFPAWGLWIDGLYGVLKLLKFVITKKTTLHEIMNSVPQHLSERKSYLIDETVADDTYTRCKLILEDLVKSEEKHELKIDGLRYDFIDGSWILLRKSGTEPKIRLYYESPTQERFNWLNQIVFSVENCIKNRNS